MKIYGDCDYTDHSLIPRNRSLILLRKMRKKKRKKMSKNKIKNLEVQRKLFKQTIYNCKKGPAMEDTQTIKKG
jgi:hypothetical protein